MTPLQKRLNRSRCRWRVDSGGPDKLCIRRGPGSPRKGGRQFWADILGHTVYYCRAGVQAINTLNTLNVIRKRHHQCGLWLSLLWHYILCIASKVQSKGAILPLAHLFCGHQALKWIYTTERRCTAGATPDL